MIRAADDGDRADRVRGEAAPDRYDASVDVVFLDRQTPGLSGEEVPRAIRDRDREDDSRVVHIMALIPDPDVLEVGMGRYVSDPVARTDLRTVVERPLARSTSGQQLRTCYRLLERYSTLEAEKAEPNSTRATRSRSGTASCRLVSETDGGRRKVRRRFGGRAPGRRRVLTAQSSCPVGLMRTSLTSTCEGWPTAYAMERAISSGVSTSIS